MPQNEVHCINYNSKQSLHLIELPGSSKYLALSVKIKQNQIKSILCFPYISDLLHITPVLPVSVELNLFLPKPFAAAALLPQSHFPSFLCPFTVLHLPLPGEADSQAGLLSPNPLPFLFPILLFSSPSHFCPTLTTLIFIAPSLQFTSFQQEETQP